MPDVFASMARQFVASCDAPVPVASTRPAFQVKRAMKYGPRIAKILKEKRYMRAVVRETGLCPKTAKLYLKIWREESAKLP